MDNITFEDLLKKTIYIRICNPLLQPYSRPN